MCARARVCACVCACMYKYHTHAHTHSLTYCIYIQQLQSNKKYEKWTSGGRRYCMHWRVAGRHGDKRAGFVTILHVTCLSVRDTDASIYTLVHRIYILPVFVLLTCHTDTSIHASVTSMHTDIQYIYYQYIFCSYMVQILQILDTAIHTGSCRFSTLLACQYMILTQLQALCVVLQIGICTPFGQHRYSSR